MKTFNPFKSSVFLTAMLLMLSQSFLLVASPYEWEKERKRTELTTVEAAMPELLIRDHKEIDYVLEDNQFLMYSTVHRIVFVNNNEAIEKNNKIYISMYNVIDLVDFKARTISKDGRVQNFDSSNIKELNNEETGSSFRIFAIEGVEIGSEVEYFYRCKMSSRLFDKHVLQHDVFVKNSSFQLTCPSHLKFDFKSYNGAGSVKTITEKERNVYKLDTMNIPMLKEEPFSFFETNRRKIEYKLAYNTARSQARLYTWDDAAKSFYSMLFELEKEEQKALEKFVKTLKYDKAGDKGSEIKKIEQYLKTNFQVNAKSSSSSLGDIQQILKVRIASKEGMTKLFVAMFQKLEIPFKVVVTCSRKDARFDGDFDSWRYLDDYLIFFPETSGFLAPYDYSLRYPMVPSEFTEQKGLFIESFQVGDVRSGLAEVGTIPASDYKLSSEEIDVDVTFLEGEESNRIKLSKAFSGYYAAFILPYLPLMTDEQKEKMVDEITKQVSPDHKMEKWDIEIQEEKVVDKLMINTTFESADFIERAGPRTLFKIGQLLGPQMEMYRDDKRTANIENDYNRAYDRKIKLHIPAGYKVKNPESLKFDVVYKDGDEVPYLFQSEYELKDNLLTVTIREYYKKIFAPVERYEDYRKVINAAADFNKVTLILEKN